MGFDWKKVLGVAAPMLGTALGGPLGGAAATALVGRLGLSKDGKPVDASNAADFEAAMADALMKPEQIVQLKLADVEFKKNMAELGFKNAADLAKISADDREGARQREMTIRDKVPAYLAAGVTLGFFGLLFFLVRHSPPTDSKDVLNIMLGSLGTAWVSIVAYYFGSSAGSAAKNEIIAKQGEK